MFLKHECLEFSTNMYVTVTSWYMKLATFKKDLLLIVTLQYHPYIAYET